MAPGEVVSQSRQRFAALLAALLLIFLALLIVANEIRYQGCVSRKYDQIAINAARDAQFKVGVQECSRLPFGA
jgi:hypothetical protein